MRIMAPGHRFIKLDADACPFDKLICSPLNKCDRCPVLVVTIDYKGNLPIPARLVESAYKYHALKRISEYYYDELEKVIDEKSLDGVLK